MSKGLAPLQKKKASRKRWHSLLLLGNWRDLHGHREPSVVVHHQVQIFIVQVNCNENQLIAP